MAKKQRRPKTWNPKRSAPKPRSVVAPLEAPRPLTAPPVEDDTCIELPGDPSTLPGASCSSSDSSNESDSSNGSNGSNDGSSDSFDSSGDPNDSNSSDGSDGDGGSSDSSEDSGGGGGGGSSDSSGDDTGGSSISSEDSNGSDGDSSNTSDGSNGSDGSGGSSNDPNDCPIEDRLPAPDAVILESGEIEVTAPELDPELRLRLQVRSDIMGAGFYTVAWDVIPGSTIQVNLVPKDTWYTLRWIL